MSGMAFLEWKHDFDLDLPAIDRQHRRLVEILNQLHDAMIKGAPAAALHKILDDLVAYTQSHFRDEEREMQKAGYPRLPEHRREHAELTSTVLRFQQDLAAGRVALSVQLLGFLKAWLREHIQKSDKAFAAHMLSCQGR
jgi:hemerythrin-like metal-binding protein